eukprot:8507043-Ditylum_brightwellii.AAC.1
MKDRLKMVMVQLARSKYHVDEVIANADYSISVPTHNLLSKSGKKNISKAMLPLILNNLVRFCKDKKILLPFLQEKNNDDNSVMSDLTTLTGMTIDIGESGDQRVYNTDRDEGDTVMVNNNNDEAPVNTILTGVDMNESPLVTNQSANTGSGDDAASHNTILTGLTIEGEANQKGNVNKNHPKTRANMHLPDIDNSGGDDTSQNTAATGLMMEGNTNNDTLTITNIVEGASNLNLDSKTINGDDDDTVLSGLTIEDDPKIQDNNEDPQIQSNNNDGTDFQQGSQWPSILAL